MRSEVVVEYLTEQAQTPFAWGTADCVQFAAGMVERLTGTNPASGHTYATEAEAQEILKRSGGLVELVTAALGPKQRLRARSLPENGDIVLTTYQSTGALLGIAYQQHALFRRSDLVGLIPVSLEQCLWFWSVPCRL
jgi:hypothetical protein